MNLPCTGTSGVGSNVTQTCEHSSLLEAPWGVAGLSTLPKSFFWYQKIRECRDIFGDHLLVDRDDFPLPFP